MSRDGESNSVSFGGRLEDQMMCHGMEDRTMCHVVEDWTVCHGMEDQMVCHGMEGRTVCHMVEDWMVCHGMDQIVWDALRVCLDPLQPCAVVTSTSVAFEGRGGGLAAILKENVSCLMNT